MVQLLLFVSLSVVNAGHEPRNDDAVFNKKNLDGWKVVGKESEGHWSVADGMIVGENKNKKGSVLWTEKKFQDFELELDYRTTSKDYDTGVFTRAASHQVQIGISRSLKKDMTGCIYAPKDKQGSYPGQTDKVNKFHKIGEWNRLKIVVQGKRIQTFLNNEPFVDYATKTMPGKGPIGLQLHGGVHMKVEFRNIRLKKLAAKNPLELFEKRVYKNKKSESLKYCLLSPPKIEEGKKYPVVLFLHGAGERGDDNHAQLVHGMKDFASPENRAKYPCYVIAPQCPKNNRWVEVAWTNSKHETPEKPSQPMRLVLELLEETIQSDSADRNRVYITGLSMGGFGTFDAISRKPELFAAALPICGGGDENMANKIKSIPLWIVHGDADRVVKPSRSKNMFDAVAKAGGEPKLTMMKGVGHNSWTATYANPKTFSWLFSQKKK